MQDLAAIIRDVAARGELNHISIAPTLDGTRFKASFSPASNCSNVFGESKDPVEAIVLAIEGAKMKRRPRVVEHPDPWE